jgi:nucleotide-binding universal stress UspA family protein
MSTRLTSRPVVVGLDGQQPGRIALDWAIDEARWRRTSLRLLHAAPMPLRGRTSEQSTEMVPRDEESAHILDEAVDRVRALSPTTPVSTSTGHGDAAVMLVEASKDASCVVVGARTRGALASAFLGSTSVDVAAHAASPVVVVRQLPVVRPNRPGVVVGSDGSAVSTAAIAEGFRQADERGLPLTVVHAWFLDPGMGLAALQSEDALRAAGEAEHALAAEALAGWSEKYPDVMLHHEVINAHPVQALVERSDGAALVIVGSRGRGGFGGLLMGSVSQGVLHHAHCPVMVVKAPPEEGS